MKNLTIYLVDDHHLFREGLKFLISKLPYVKDIYEASNGQQFLDSLAEINPDIVLMDIEMPVLDGIHATKKAIDINPDLKVIALSMYSDENYYQSMIDAGARGFLLKNSTFEDVERALHEIYQGNCYFSTEIMNDILKNLNKKKIIRQNQELTQREIEILFNICKGLSNNEIAEKLFISKRTVDKHRENLLLKTKSKNTANLVVFAIKSGIFEI